MNDTQGKYTVWHYVGCGCAVLFVLAVLGIGGCFFMAHRWGEQMQADMEDPAARMAKARSILGSDELPEGYHPGLSIRIPFFMDWVMLGDQELPADLDRVNSPEEIFGERGFLYTRMRSFGQDRSQMHNEMNVDFDPEETVAEGEVEAGGATVRYTSALGTTDLGARDVRSVTAELEIDCGDGYVRQGLWFMPVPAAEEEAGEGGGEASAPDLTGTPADEEALRAFLDHFRFCG